MSVTYDFAGQVVLVTGGSSGIGRGIAAAFLKYGATVVINYLEKAEEDSVNNLIEESGGRGISFRADVAIESEVERMVQFVITEQGKLDILVNNAGIVRSSSIEDTPTKDWLDIFGVHVNGTFFCTRAVLPHMYKKNYGRIINTASQLAYKGAPGFAHYTAAKGAIISFTRTLALEIGDRNICANTVAPGATRTPILNAVPQNTLDEIRNSIPRGTLAEVQDIVGTYLFLAGEAAVHYRGQCLSPNGGDVFL